MGCSQYPGEKEITFPPFTCLEADGDPRVEATDKGEIVIFPLKVHTSVYAVHARDAQEYPKIYSL